MAGVGFPCPAGMAIPEIPEPVEPAGAVRRDDIFIKENEALNLIFTRIIRPAFVAGRDPAASFVDYRTSITVVWEPPAARSHV
jgi:hypothetical protein